MPILKAFPKRPLGGPVDPVLAGWLDLIWQLIKSDQYTPVCTAVTNVDACSGQLSEYCRIGDGAIAFGAVEIDPTAGGGAATTIRFSLPIPSNLVSNFHLVGWAFTNSDNTARITADTTNNEAQLDLVGGAGFTASRRFFFFMFYRIIQ